MSWKLIATRGARSALWALVALAGVFVGVAHAAQGDGHPGLTRYPTEEQVRAKAVAAKAADPVADEAARRDFDLAIRSVFVLTPPRIPGEGVPHVPRKLGLWTLRVKPGFDLSIDAIARRANGQPVAQFYRDHYDEFCVEDTPELRAALGDILLNGWDDWSEWEGEKLTEVRTTFPELHRAYALQLAQYFYINDFNGIILQILLDASTPSYVRRSAESALTSMDNNVDVLDLVVTRILTAKEEVVRRSFLNCIGTISGDVDPYERRVFWRKYLDTTDRHLRSNAVIQMGGAIGAIRSKSKGKDMSPDILAKLKQIAENDADRHIRFCAARAVKSHESEPFRGLVRHGPEEDNPNK